MIFVFLDDGTLDVVEDLTEAQREYEGIDVESEVFKFYDDLGRFLAPRFITPNQRYLSGLIIASGQYVLEPAQDPIEDPIGLVLFETSHVNENRWFKSLEEVRAFLLRRGVDLTVKPPITE
jgi:hypothetical protein